MKIAIVGVGNILMGDEGFGVKVIQYLKNLKLPENVSLIDAGTWFFNVASSLSDYDRVIIIDIAKGGRDPGTIYRFTEDDIKENVSDSISLHDFGVVESLNLERLVRKMPEDILFFGIEPLKIELSMELSDRLKDKVREVADLVLNEIKKQECCR